MASASANTSDPKQFSKRKLGNNELFVNLCHDNGNLNVMCGLTLVTRQAIDEGLMKCALQEFQHMYPQLTSRIRRDDKTNSLCFIPMECPIFPLDTEFKCQDMLHEKFDTENGPLWRVQLITESSMEKAGLNFGPELSAIVSDDTDVSTRWRHFLRYFQGNVNGKEIEPFDSEEEGFRSFILITFHPSITDTLGSFHLMRQFLYILDTSLEDGGTTSSPEPEDMHQSIESLLPSGESSLQLSDTLPMFKVIGNFMMPRKNLFEEYKFIRFEQKGKTEMIRGRLDEEQSAELNAMMEEDDASLHGVLLAAGLVAVSRVLQSQISSEYPPSRTLTLRATNEANLRQYCESAPKHGCLTTYYEENFSVPCVSDKTEFWRFAHEMTVKNNAAKGNREPLKLLRIYSKMFSLGGENSFKDMEKQCRLQNELGVAVYGDLGSLFRRELQTTTPMDYSWNRPLSASQRNIRLEDVFHMVAAQHMGSPMTLTAHTLYGKLNYILMFHTTYIEASVAFKVRDEVSDILRMATEKS